MIRYYFIVLLASLSSLSFADERDDFPTCYKILGMQELDTTANRELFVLVDQTMVLDENLRRSIHQKIRRFLMPGDKITLMVFSAYVKDRYTDLLLTGQLDFMLQEKNRYNISKKRLKRFDHCMGKQKKYVNHSIDEKLNDAFDSASTNVPKTELAGNLARIGESLIALSNAHERVVLIVSDMLENSDMVTFYRNNRVMAINVKEALRKIQGKALVSDWGGARVYVVGAAYVSGEGQSAYRSEAVMKSIHEFWKGYFSVSNARLSGWGQPALLVDIK